MQQPIAKYIFQAKGTKEQNKEERQIRFQSGTKEGAQLWMTTNIHFIAVERNNSGSNAQTKFLIRNVVGPQRRNGEEEREEKEEEEEEEEEEKEKEEEELEEDEEEEEEEEEEENEEERKKQVKEKKKK